jgi:hypothetical protein
MAMVTTFFICVMMMLPLLMIRNVRAKIILFKNNVTRLIVDVDYVLSRDAMLAYMKDYLPHFLWFGLQILPMFIFLFSMVYCVCTIARRRHRVQMSERSHNNTHIFLNSIIFALTLRIISNGNIIMTQMKNVVTIAITVFLMVNRNRA